MIKLLQLVVLLALFTAPAIAQTRYYLGPYVWVSDANGERWQPPVGATAAVDLRPLSAQGTPGPAASGAAFFATSGTLGAPYVLLGQNNNPAAITATAGMRSAWQTATGYSPSGANLQAMLWDQLTAGSDPAGMTGPKPLMPTMSGMLEMSVGPSVRAEEFRLGVHVNSAKVEAVHQADYRKIVEDAAAQRVPSDLPGKLLDFWAEKYRLNKADRNSWERLVPTDLRSTAVLVPHQTTLNETFNTADSDTVGPTYTWTEVSGDADIVSNEVSYITQNSSLLQTTRAEADVSSTDMYGELNVTNVGTGVNAAHIGPAVRFQPAATTFYTTFPYQLDDKQYCRKVVATVQTDLATAVAITLSIPEVYKVQANGSTIKCYQAGVQRFSVTDTTITSGTRGGIQGYRGSGHTAPVGDDWKLEDIAVGWGSGGTPQCQDANEAAATTSLSCTLGAEIIEAGNVAVVVCATDNVTASDSNTNDHSVVTDSGGNTYTKAYEYTEGSAGAGAGATVSVHFSKLTTQLTNITSTITCNFASVTDKAIHLVGEFTIGSGNTGSVAGTPQGEASNGGDAGNLTIGSLTSGEYLFVRAIATESNAALSMTASSSYSIPTVPSDGCNNTISGGEATDMGACSEYRIFTGTGDSSNPTLVDTSNDNASVFVALKQAAPAAGGTLLMLMGVGR